MAKTKKSSVRELKQKPGFSLNSIIPEKYQTGSLLLFIFLLLLIYLSPLYFGDKTFQSGDVYSQYSYKNFSNKTSKLIWDPYIFCGIPMFGGAGWNDIFTMIIGTIRTFFENIFGNMYAGYSIFLLVLSYGVYSLMRYLKATRLVSLLSSVATMFSLAIITLLFIGHLNKLTTLVVFPIIFLMLLKFQEKIKLIDVLVLILALKFMFSQWHIQIIFYTYLALGIYYIYYFVWGFIKERGLIKQLVKSAAILIVASGLGFAMQYTTLGQVYEYSQYSTRGSASITDKVKSGGDEKSNEGYYKYHTDWSFSPGEVMTFIVPSFYGFGSSTYNGPLTQNTDQEINTYFGQMPFTDAAVYMGIIIFALALFAVFTRWKEPIVQVMAIISLIFLIISFGRNFPLLFDPLFYNFPYFDKFRAPVMILNIVQIFVPVLAGLGLMKIFQLREERNANIEKYLKYAAYAFAGIFVVALVLNGPLSDWFISRVAATDKGKQLAPVHEYMSSMFMSDVYVSFGLLALTFGLILGYLKNKLSFDALIIIVIALSIFDIWRIDMRALHFSEKINIESLYTEPDYVQFIKQQQQGTEPYRILNLKQDNTLGSIGQNVNFHVSFLMEDFYGYSGIKPRSYQDYIDVVSPANYSLWRMLNVKYVITEKPVSFPGLQPIYSSQTSAVHLNTGALGRAYFVDSVAVKQPMEILQAVKNNAFDPKHVAFLENGEKLNIDKSDSSASVKIADYNETYIKMNANATGNNFLFIGNTFYPNGWKTFVDGAETATYNANHGFTGLVVPNGSHTVELVYEPAPYVLGRTLTLILNLGLVGAFAFYFITLFINKKKELPQSK
ncbi:MAG TPA: YfhO family protein [Ignavibacteriales bacterium]|nr:YfhO family protein [Ignavibacteriales bacterium]